MALTSIPNCYGTNPREFLFRPSPSIWPTNIWSHRVLPNVWSTINRTARTRAQKIPWTLRIRCSGWISRLLHHRPSTFAIWAENKNRNSQHLVDDQCALHFKYSLRCVANIAELCDNVPKWGLLAGCFSTAPVNQETVSDTIKIISTHAMNTYRADQIPYT